MDRGSRWVGQHIGSYRIVRLIGQGGMGAVYEAVHQTIGERAAVKILHAQYCHNAEVMRRFVNEARAVAIIRHPSLVRVFDAGQLPDGTGYLLMEYLDGESLLARLKRMGRLPLEEACHIVRQMAAALQAAHDKAIVHRDIKPAKPRVHRRPPADGPALGRRPAGPGDAPRRRIALRGGWDR